MSRTHSVCPSVTARTVLEFIHAVAGVRCPSFQGVDGPRCDDPLVRPRTLALCPPLAAVNHAAVDLVSKYLSESLLSRLL